VAAERFLGMALADAGLSRQRGVPQCREATVDALPDELLLAIFSLLPAATSRLAGKAPSHCSPASLNSR
jgi:hypothetical protein